MVNKVILIGNLGRDPEIRFTTDRNTAVANLALATTRRYRTPDGQTTEETEWHRVVFFGRQAEIARDYLRKGRQIYVEGRLRTRKWTDQEGRDHYTTEIIAAATMKTPAPPLRATASKARPVPLPPPVRPPRPLRSRAPCRTTRLSTTTFRSDRKRSDY